MTYPDIPRPTDIFWILLGPLPPRPTKRPHVFRSWTPSARSSTASAVGLCWTRTTISGDLLAPGLGGRGVDGARGWVRGWAAWRCTSRPDLLGFKMVQWVESMVDG